MNRSRAILLAAAMGAMSVAAIDNYRITSVNATTSDCCTVGTDCQGSLLCCNNVSSSCEAGKKHWCKMSC